MPPMALAVEAALTAVELIDVGWSKLTNKKTKSQQVVEAAEKAAWEDRALVLEGELAKERVEHQKLAAAIEEFKGLLLQLHNQGGSTGPFFAANADIDAESLIRSIEEKVNSPDFLDHLLAPPDAEVIRGDIPVSVIRGEVKGPIRSWPSMASGDEGSPSNSVASEGEPSQVRAVSSGGVMEVSVDAGEDEDTGEVSESWQWVTAREMRGGLRTSTEPCSGLDSEVDYELVDGDDVVEGISLVLARYISSHPEYHGLTCEELQKAMSSGIKDLKGKGVMRALWDWSKFVYKASRWTASAYNVYRHPLMVRAVLLALMSSTRIILGFSLI